MRIFAACLLASLPLSAADWVRLKTPDVELLTDAGEKSGRETLARLTQIRDSFAIHSDYRLNLRIFLFSSEREFRGYTANAATDGFFQSAPEQDYIVLHAGPALGRATMHEYIHLLLNHGTVPLPLWFEEGLAEFYSTMLYSSREARGNRLVIGEPIAAHRAALEREQWLTASQLFGADKKSSLYDERRRAGLFYAQSWGLVHMLNLSKQYRDGMPRFAELLASGAEVDMAFAEAFRRSPEQALADAKLYIARAASVTVDGAPTSPLNATLERVSEIDALILRAELALRTDHPDLGRKLYQQASREHPNDPATEAGLGMLAIFDRDRAAARQHLERATSLGTTAAVWFEYAMFEREEGAPRALVDELLRKAVAMNPNLAEAQFVLGVRASDDGEYDEAISHLKEAVRVLPRQSSFWHALAFAQAMSGSRAEALTSARVAARTALTPEEEGMAASLVEALTNP